MAVVIPCYKARRHIAEVLAGLAGRVRHIYVVDDCCSEQTGRFVQEVWKDANVSVVFLTENQGVGGAVLAGYRQALKDGHEIVVKMDGDNQMDPAYLPALITPLVQGEADYAKGNRFFDVYSLGAMPAIRLLGNASLSFIVKMASGYWDIMDPTNGYTAIHHVACGVCRLTVSIDAISSNGYAFPPRDDPRGGPRRPDARTLRGTR